jgi:hypothetical protein
MAKSSWTARAARGEPATRAEALMDQARVALFKATAALVDEAPPEVALIWTSRALLALAEADAIVASIGIAKRVLAVQGQKADAGTDE